MQETNANINPSPTTYLVKSIRGSRRIQIYYDPDIFREQILLSASLLIGEDESPFKYHYNTVHDEITDGTNYQDINEITIPICPLPIRTDILGTEAPDLDKANIYKVPESYDFANEYTYGWSVDNSATIIENTGKQISVVFSNIGKTTITLIIENNCGCKREMSLVVYPDSFQRSMLVLRNTYL